MDEVDIDRQALVQSFVAEGGDLLDQMERDLVTFETRSEDDEVLKALFRAAHTLKGSASLVAFDGVRDLAHELENLLERLRAKTLRMSDVLATLLLRSVDVLRRLVAEAAAGRAEPLAEAESLRRSLAEAVEGKGTGEAGPGAVEGTPVAAPTSRTLRVDVAKLDKMLNVSGEIAISRGRLTDMLERRTSLTVEEILEAHREADRLYLDLQDLIMKARMVPIGPIFQQQVRMVRDVASAEGKRVRLHIEGGDVEVDTSVVEHIRDPLTHMVRNALDHGIEPPEVRSQRGKDPVGRVTLRARHEGSSIVIEVSDDGGGIDRARVAEKAQELGFLEEGSALGEEELQRLIFEPGFSTSRKVTEISGRGVGMDVVRRNVEALRGSVSVASEAGKGTTVTLRLPLTLAIIQGFKVRVGDEIYILPLDAVVECVELPGEERSLGAATGVLALRGKPLPYLRLRRHFRVQGPAPARENVVVVRHGTATAGVAVDVLLGESQTVVKPLGRMFQGIPGVSGSSIMGDGRVALILDVAGLLREALRNAAARA